MVTLVFAKTCILPPTKSDLKFALYIVNLKKKNLLFVKKYFFFGRNEQHLVRGFQKGITLGVLSHIFGVEWMVGVAEVGGVARGELGPSRPQVLYLFGILSPNGECLCRKKNVFLQIGRFFF